MTIEWSTPLIWRGAGGTPNYMSALVERGLHNYWHPEGPLSAEVREYHTQLGKFYVLGTPYEVEPLAGPFDTLEAAQAAAEMICEVRQ